MQLTPPDFRMLLQTDIWVLKQVLTLPSDPEAEIVEKDGTIVVAFTDTMAMSQMQEAVTEYRRKLAPAIFIVSQKIYAELFRLVLNAANGSAGRNQIDVENKIQGLMAPGSLTNPFPFSTQSQLLKWWSGTYDFKKLREARNRIVHESYQVSGGILDVQDNGALLLRWSENEIITFAQSVHDMAEKI
jgi:hypothetical protein